ncbi:hypothetical protein NVP1084O_100 [Vibrio phage 1.084.O._10N.261.49.F5]|nr:hypothetical protein NVP1084O_100 [Vibrio phage 1.084.O._10N.261.49.F5]
MYTCYNISKEVGLELNDYQQSLLDKLLNGEVSKIQFANMRSNARRSNNILKSVELATVFEIYKYRINNAEERKEQGDG